LFSPSLNRSNISSVCRHSPTFPNATLASGFSKEARPHSPFPTRDSTFPLGHSTHGRTRRSRVHLRTHSCIFCLIEPRKPPGATAMQIREIGFP
jgi:hypothetical protein